MHNQMIPQLQHTLQNTFGFSEFRPGQLEAMTLLLTHGRLLCVQPTGYGKSLLYQLPAVLLEGITLVVSPLLALMRDQLSQLKNRFNISAASINTDQTEQENYAARQAARAGKIKILFIAPEQLDHIDRFDFLMSLPISLLVVDEAHCISTWGHDFRPSYRQIIKLADALIKQNPAMKLLGLTATANAKTELDITQQLNVDKTTVFIHRENMDRPNIRLSVVRSVGVASKLAQVVELLQALSGSGLIYCATRENTELVASYLREQGLSIVAYHAGMDTHQKRLIQQDFIQDKYPVIVATNALGMGIDKSNLRFVIHFDFPGSITAYYQEVGRCGRDGLPAEGILLYDPADNKVQRYFIDAAQPTRHDVESILNTISQSRTPINLALLKRLTGLHPTRLTVILSELVEQGFIQKSSLKGLLCYELTSKLGSPDLNRYTNQLAVRNTELKAMQSYAEQVEKCLMQVLRIALGDADAKPCGQCSGCTLARFKSVQDKHLNFTISSWLQRRTVSISLSKKITRCLSGIAALDGKLRSKDFISFMRERATSNVIQIGISDTLMQLVKTCLADLTKHYKLGCIVAVPSRTWGARDAVISLLANYLKIPAFHHVLSWQIEPAARQGELLNNDQRQHNVSQHMRATYDKKMPSGAILLLDDYIGSGATLNEAARTLREQVNIDNIIIPFTIAGIKWRLGKSGMI